MHRGSSKEMEAETTSPSEGEGFWRKNSLGIEPFRTGRGPIAANASKSGIIGFAIPEVILTFGRSVCESGRG